VRNRNAGRLQGHGPASTVDQVSVFWMILVVVLVVGVVVGGYFYNRSGPGDYVRNPNIKARRNNWVP
jgi:hypothetical protein